MRVRSKFVSVVMVAVMLMLTVGVANAFAGMSQKHETPHAGMDCPCPDKANCPDETPCQDVSACIAGCLHFFTIDLVSVVARVAQPQDYAQAPIVFAGGLTRPPPLPPPTA
ncbi:MAG: hypothetical protein K1X51_03905 [Rhodospirillaceae bacterium]|nr:hypothetical protein [Rhodospirillaceae bacterium]